MNTRLILIASTILFSVSALAARISISPADNKVTVPKVVTVYADWVKDKGKKYDLGFTISNEYDKNIMVMGSELKCARGGLPGQVDIDKTITLKPGELKKLTLVCKLGSLSDGDYKVVVSSVYENASGDGKTVGKSIAKDIEWHVRIAK